MRCKGPIMPSKNLARLLAHLSTITKQHFFNIIPLADACEAKKANFAEHIFSTPLTKFYEPKCTPAKNALFGDDV